MNQILPSLLFVPASRPDRFEKALGSAAALVCIDLEDAVPAADKDSARAAAVAAGPHCAVRINGLRTPAGLADVLALVGWSPRAVLIPMVEAAAELEIVRAALGDVPLIPLIETIAGLAAAPLVAKAHGVAAVMLGGADLAAELGVALAWEPLLMARAQLVAACAAAGVPAIDVPWTVLDDDAGLAAEAARAKALGFAGKAAIHPRQVAAIEATFRPSAAEREEASAALAAFADAGGAAVRFRGRMLEAPLMARYRRLAGS